ncbi:MAG: polysaccharide biosynthesis tyrosine autokinase [bacterium]|nr:polysaccharide biosynthesis tyrosine autokinase [bacterium]
MMKNETLQGKLNPAETSQPGLQDLLRIIIRRRWIVLGAFLSVLVSSIIFSFRQPNIYEASISLLVQRDNKPILGMMLETEQSRNMINNQVEIIRSRSLAAEAATLLRARPDAAQLGFIAGDLLTEYIQYSITVLSARTTDIITVIATSNNPVQAEAMANTVGQAYIARNLSYSRGEFSEVRRFLEVQLPVIEKRLFGGENQLRLFKQTNQVVSLSDESKFLIDKLTGFESQYNLTKVDRESAEKRLAYLQDQLDFQKKNMLENVSQVSSPLASGLRQDLLTLQTQMATMTSQGFPGDHPKMKELTKKIENTKSRLKEEISKIVAQKNGGIDPIMLSEELVVKILDLQVEIETYKAKELAQQRVVNEYLEKLKAIPPKEVELARLTRQFELDDNIYKMLMEKYEEVRISEAGKLGNVKIIDRAQVPKEPVGPRRKLNILFGGMLGLALGIGLVLLMEYMDTSLKNIHDIEQFLALPVLGMIPAIDQEDVASQAENGKTPNGATSIAERLISHHLPKSPISEAYRILRTNLQFLNPDAPLKTILVTSSGPSEGKTTTAANLAITMAQVGSRTLIVDADLRRPMVNGVFGIPQEPGLTELLVKGGDLQKAMVSTDIENLFILPAGTIPPNPSELLSSQKMKRLIQEMKNCCDLVILDCPPVITVTDAAVLAAEADCVVLVIQSGKTDREAARRAKSLLTNVKAKIAGAVLNNISSDMLAGYSYYYHYYYEDGHRKKGGKGKRKNKK